MNDFEMETPELGGRLDSEVALEAVEQICLMEKVSEQSANKLNEKYMKNFNCTRIPGAKRQLYERRYSCPYCSLRLVSRSNLYTHIRLHTGAKPFVCEVCGKTENTRFNLDRHVQTHYRMYDYMCGECKKTFNSLFAVKKHIRNVHKKDDKDVDHFRIKKKTVKGKEMMFIKAVHNNSNYYRLFHIITEEEVISRDNPPIPSKLENSDD